MATGRATTAGLRRCFSNAPSSSSAAAAADATPWLDRAASVWDRESGTLEILRLKRKVDESSLAFDSSRRHEAAARTALNNAMRAFEESQVKHARLLQCRDRWTPGQAAEFAKLLEEEVRARRELEARRESLAGLEGERSSAMDGYMNDLRRRYHEEQLWQDRWRVYGTFGTWGLIVLNSAVFLASQYLYREREARRTRDVEELVRRSLVATREGAAVEEREPGRQIVAVDGSAEETTMCVRQNGQRRANENQSNSNALPDGYTTADMTGEQCTNEEPPVTAASPEDNTIDSKEGESSPRKLETPPSSPSSLSTLPPRKESHPVHYWTRMRQQLAASSAMVNRYLQENCKSVDLPSAMLGASVTGLAWIATTALFSSPNGAR